MPAKRTVTVVGGGVIGLTTAYALLQAGHSVGLVEQENNVGTQCSFGNAGQLSYRYVRPLADSGVPFEALEWLFQKNSPISLNLRSDWRQWRWLWEFFLACNARTNYTNAKKLLALALKSQDVLSRWRQEGLENFLWRQPGKLVLYRNQEKFKKASQSVGNPELERVLTPEECVAVEPVFSGLKSVLAGGVFAPEDEVADCYLFCQSLFKAVRSNSNFHFIQAQASFKEQGVGQCQLYLNGQAYQTDLVVLAAGLASRDLVRPLGMDLPLYGLKGYSLTVEGNPAALPNVSMTDYDNRVVYARLGNKLRIAAMVDIGAPDNTPTPSRIQALKNLATQTLPAAGPYIKAQPWAGMRPATPTGVPLIGRTRWRNLLLNVGHGALGFTLSGGSAVKIRDIIEGM